MTDDTKQAWSEVGEKFASWGRRVSDRYKDSGRTEAEAEASTRELERVAREVVDGVTRGVTAVGGTLRDHEATEDLKAAVSALGDAITTTVTEAADGIRSARSSTTSSSGDGTTPAADAPDGDDEEPGDGTAAT